MTPPRTSIILRDPARLAAVLLTMQHIGRPAARGGYDALTLRGFARAVGISAPSLLALTRGECRRMRFLTYLKLQRYAGLLSAGSLADYDRRSRALKGVARSMSVSAVIREVNSALRPFLDHSDVAAQFYRCVDETFGMPFISTAERQRLEAIVDRQPRRRFLRVRPAEVAS